MRLVMSSLATVAAAVALTGCGEKGKDAAAESTPTPQVKVIQPGAPGEPSREVVATSTPEGENGHTKDFHRHTPMPGMVNSRQLARLKATEGVEFDRLFLRYMTQHHEGALTMVQRLVDEGGGGEIEIGQFILHVDSDQSIEIKRMAEVAKKL
jgi:uncharacterized protein (DUF305 family)